MSKKTLLVMGIGVLVGLGVAVRAADRPDGPPDRDGQLEQELGLSEAQIDQLDQLRSQERKAAIRRRADRQVARLELRDLLKADTVDEKAVMAKAKRLADLEAAGALARGEAAIALRKIVSADQAEKLFRARHQFRGGRRGPGRDRRAPRSEGRLQPGANAESDEPMDMAEAADEL